MPNGIIPKSKRKEKEQWHKHKPYSFNGNHFAGNCWFVCYVIKIIEEKKDIKITWKRVYTIFSVFQKTVLPIMPPLREVRRI